MTFDPKKTAWLWFAGKDGWQVTSFDPREDKAIGFKEDATCWVPEADMQAAFDEGRQSVLAKWPSEDEFEKARWQHMKKVLVNDLPSTGTWKACYEWLRERLGA